MTIANSSMKLLNHVSQEEVGIQAEDQAEEGHHQAKATNQRYASSGNKEDATEVMSANSNMKAKQGNLGRLPQLGQVLMIQKAVVKVEGKDVEAEVGQGPNPRSHQSRLNHQRTALDRTQPRPRKPRPRHPLPQCV